MQKTTETLKKYERENLESSLKKEWQNTKKNPQVEKLIENLYSPDDILMKYASLLEESAIEYSHCMQCKNLAECQNKISGHAYLPIEKEGKLTFSYQACRYQKKYQKENAYQENIALFEVPKEIKTAKMKDIYPNEQRFQTIKWIKQFMDNYPNEKKGLYLYGNFGCGKSYLIAAMFNELAKKEIKSAIVFWPEFLRDLKSSFGIDFESKIKYIKKVPLLLIDDIGAENTTAWARDEILCPILQYRMDEKLPTFFTSNLDLLALEQHLATTKDGVEVVKARRLIERIKQLTYTQEMISKNLRK